MSIEEIIDRISNVNAEERTITGDTAVSNAVNNDQEVRCIPLHTSDNPRSDDLNDSNHLNDDFFMLMSSYESLSKHHLLLLAPNIDAGNLAIAASPKGNKNLSHAQREAQMSTNEDALF